MVPGSVCDQPVLPNGQPCTGQWARRGKINIRAGLQTLIERYGLDDADAQVLFMGTSAGGYGVQHTAHLVAEALPQTAARGDLKVLADGAWAWHWDDPTYRMGDQYSSVDVPDLYAGHASLVDRLGGVYTPACTTGEASAGRDPRRCAHSSVNLAWLRKPVARGGLGLQVYVQKALVDSLEMGFHLDPSHVRLEEDQTGALSRWVRDQRRQLSPVDWGYICAHRGHTTMNSDRWWNADPARGWPGLSAHVEAFWAWDGVSPIPAQPPCNAAQCLTDTDCPPLLPGVTGGCINRMCLARTCLVDADCGSGALCRSQQCVTP